MPDEIVFIQTMAIGDLSEVEKITFRLLEGDVRVIAECEERNLLTAFTLTQESALALERWLGERRRLLRNREMSEGDTSGQHLPAD